MFILLLRSTAYAITFQSKSLTSYLAKFKARVEVIKGAGGKPGHHDGAVKLVCATRKVLLLKHSTQREMTQQSKSRDPIRSSTEIPGCSNFRQAWQCKKH